MKTQGFFNRDYNKNTFYFDNCFEEKNGFFWFVELQKTSEWLTEERLLTKDPLKAKQFKTQMSALEYCVVNKLGVEYIQTEHQFINLNP